MSILQGLGSTLNFVPKTFGAAVLHEALAGITGPAVVLDARAGTLIGANGAGLELWGLDTERLSLIVLDRAMPALAELRRRVGYASDLGTREEPLTFWTPAGLLCRACSTQHLPQAGDNAPTAVFLIEWPRDAITARGGTAVLGPAADAAPPALAVHMVTSGPLEQAARRMRERAHAHPAPSSKTMAGTVAAPDHEGDALANLAHELRTPLAAVIALAEIMTEEHLGPLPNERYRGYLRDIRDSARHGLALVDNLLGRERAESGDMRLELVCSQVDLNEAARSCMATVQPLASKAGMTLSAALEGGLPHVIADLRCVKQILLNLLSNSIKYAGSGAKITVRTAYELAGCAWIEVADNGPGIAPEIAASALEQVPRPVASGRHSSNGRGLPLSRQLAHANGARLEIECAAGGGTVVRVAFAKDRLVPV